MSRISSLRLHLCYEIHALRVEWAQAMKRGEWGEGGETDGNARNIFMISQNGSPSQSSEGHHSQASYAGIHLLLLILRRQSPVTTETIKSN